MQSEEGVAIKFAIFVLFFVHVSPFSNLSITLYFTVLYSLIPFTVFARLISFGTIHGNNVLIFTLTLAEGFCEEFHLCVDIAR